MKMLTGSGHFKASIVACQVFGIAALLLLASPSTAIADSTVDATSSRGYLAETLVGIEMVQTSDAILSSAPVGSLEGKLYAYQQARLALESAVAAQNEAYADYRSLLLIAKAHETAGAASDRHHFAVAEAANTYNWFQQRAEEAQSVTQAALLNLCDGRGLSDMAMRELHAMLGL